MILLYIPAYCFTLAKGADPDAEILNFCFISFGFSLFAKVRITEFQKTKN